MGTETTLLFLNMSGGEIFVIMLFILLFFGADSVPKMARSAGKVLYQIRNATEDIKKDIRSTADNVKKDIMDQTAVENNPLNDLKKDIDESIKDINI